MKTPNTLRAFAVLQPSGKNNPKGWMTFHRRSAEPVGWDVYWQHDDRHTVCTDRRMAEIVSDLKGQTERQWEATHEDADGSVRVVSNITTA